jgi:DNA polymerase elongation subunit (family B)
MPFTKTNVFIDAEWYLSQHIFLVGYAVTSGRKTKFGQLYGKQLTKPRFRKIVNLTTGFIFGYGPDVGMMEKFFSMKLRKKFYCVNLMKPFRDHLKLGSFKLADLEVKFKLVRKVVKYKQTIWHIWRDWKDPRKRVAVLTYNQEDVLNLVKLTRIIFRKFKITIEYLRSVRLA